MTFSSAITDARCRRSPICGRGIPPPAGGGSGGACPRCTEGSRRRAFPSPSPRCAASPSGPGTTARSRPKRPAPSCRNRGCPGWGTGIAIGSAGGGGVEMGFVMILSRSFGRSGTRQGDLQSVGWGISRSRRQFGAFCCRSCTRFDTNNSVFLRRKISTAISARGIATTLRFRYKATGRYRHP